MLYLVKINDEYLKIGFTKNLINRLKGLETTSLSVELIASREGTRKEEKILHLACAPENIRSELFKYDPRVIEVFKNYVFDPELERVSRLEKSLNKHIAENRDLLIENRRLRSNYRSLKSEYETYVSMYNKMQDDISTLKALILTSNNEINENNPIEMPIMLKYGTISKTPNWFWYIKKFPHKGENNILVKYLDGVIDLGDSKLFYNMKEKVVFTSSFRIAKSYPVDHKTLKYYYYDTDKSISFSDIQEIVSIIKEKFES